jgi:hypothetical protein
MTITAVTHPALHAALVTLLSYNGMCHCMAVQPDTLTPPARLADLAAPAEAALAKRTDEEREILIDGEESERLALLGQHPDLEPADTLLASIFDQYDETTGIWGDCTPQGGTCHG